MACAKRLNLKIVRKECAGLQGLGQAHCSVNQYDVVELIVGPPHGKHSVKIDTLVVSSLNPIYMPGVCRLLIRSTPVDIH